MMKAINPSSSWGLRLKALLETGFPNLNHLGLNLLSMGVDEGWQTRDW